MAEFLLPKAMQLATAFKESLAAFTQSIGALPLQAREDLLGATAARVYRIEG